MTPPLQYFSKSYRNCTYNLNAGAMINWCYALTSKSRHSRESGNLDCVYMQPFQWKKQTMQYILSVWQCLCKKERSDNKAIRIRWIPAFAGMTAA